MSCASPPTAAVIYNDNQALQKPHSETLQPCCGIQVNSRLLLCESPQNAFPQQREDNMTGTSSCAITVKGVPYSLSALERTVNERERKKCAGQCRIAISVKINHA